MDMQLKRGLFEICVLAAIRDEDSYGYRIIKTIKPYIDISESTLYPILRRLEHNGRLRKYYHINQAGKERLCAFSEEWREISAIYQFVTREESENE